MRKILIISALSAYLGGCAQDIYDKADGTQEQFNVDMGGCQMFAMGVPQVQPGYVPPSYTANTSYSGAYMGGPNMGTLNGSSTTIVQPDNSGQAMANLGAAIGTAGRQKQALRACMAAHGYTLRR